MGGRRRSTGRGRIEVIDDHCRLWQGSLRTVSGELPGSCSGADHIQAHSVQLDDSCYSSQIRIVPVFFWTYSPCRTSAEKPWLDWVGMKSATLA